MRKVENLCVNCEHYIPDPKFVNEPKYATCANEIEQDAVSGEITNVYCNTIRYRSVSNCDRCPNYKEKAV